MAMYKESEYRRTWRRNLAANDRQARFIMAYVSVTQPEVYNEAIEFHNKLRKKHPQKLDLRKAYEFMQLQPKKNRVSFTDKLELRIPLMSSTQHTPSTTSTPCTTSVPEPTSTPCTTSVPEPTSTPCTTSVAEPTSTTCTTSVPEPKQSDEATTLKETFQSGEIPLLDDDTMKQLIDELQEDPQLATFFDNMDIDIEIPDMRPLEVELLNH